MNYRRRKLLPVLLSTILLLSNCQGKEDLTVVAPDDPVHEEKSVWSLQLTGVDSTTAMLEIHDQRSSSACSTDLLLRFEHYSVPFDTQSMDCQTRGGSFAGRDSSTSLNATRVASLMIVDPSTLLVHAPPRLLRSTDGGNRWRDVSPVTAGSTIVTWTRHGSASGMLYLCCDGDEGSFLYRSSDLGDHWERFTTREGGYRILTVQPGTGILYAMEYDYRKTDILRSSDRGEHWEEAFSFGDDRVILNVAFDDAGRFYAVTDWIQLKKQPLIAISDDGLHWKVRVIRNLHPLTGIGSLSAAGDGMLLISGRGGETVESTDQGETWHVAACKPGVVYASLALIIPGARWLLKTTDGLFGKFVGEEIWTKVETTLKWQSYGLQRDAFGSVWAVTSSHIFRSSDQGSRFEQVDREPAWCTLAFTRSGDTLTGTYSEQPVKSGPVTTWTVRGVRIP